MTQSPPRAQTLPVLPANLLRVCDGVNMGDAISYSGELILDDVYALTRDQAPGQIALQLDPEGQFSVDATSPTGLAGARIHLDCAISLMSTDGQTTEALIFVETDADGHVAQIYLSPLAALSEGQRYTLVGIDAETAPQMLSQLACARFSRGTRITLSTGIQQPIEDLQVGDMVLTRDDGPQAIRWIGRSTVRATGDLAPIRILAGTLNNSDDLLVSPDHRLFIYQRRDNLGTGRAELLVKARHLVNDTTVKVQEGGFVEYFQLLFDTHQIIYAEGIAAESMIFDMHTRNALPEEIGANLPEGQSNVSGLDVTESLLDRPDAAELLRKASRPE